MLMICEEKLKAWYYSLDYMHVCVLPFGLHDMLVCLKLITFTLAAVLHVRNTYAGWCYARPSITYGLGHYNFGTVHGQVRPCHVEITTWLDRITETNGKNATALPDHAIWKSPPVSTLLPLIFWNHAQPGQTMPCGNHHLAGPDCRNR